MKWCVVEHQMEHLHLQPATCQHGTAEPLVAFMALCDITMDHNITAKFTYMHMSSLCSAGAAVPISIRLHL